MLFILLLATCLFCRRFGQARSIQISTLAKMHSNTGEVYFETVPSTHPTGELHTLGRLKEDSGKINFVIHFSCAVFCQTLLATRHLYRLLWFQQGFGRLLTPIRTTSILYHGPPLMHTEQRITQSWGLARSELLSALGWIRQSEAPFSTFSCPLAP